MEIGRKIVQGKGGGGEYQARKITKRKENMIKRILKKKEKKKA